MLEAQPHAPVRIRCETGAQPNRTSQIAAKEPYSALLGGIRNPSRGKEGTCSTLGKVCIIFTLRERASQEVEKVKDM